MNIVLHEPEIPANTGNIGRTCAAAGIWLHLIKPLGFSTDDKQLKRAGMDYWHLVNVQYYDDFNDFILKNDNPRLFLATTKGSRRYTDVDYGDDPYIVFGKESAGLPAEIREAYPDSCIRIPMMTGKRSLNLGNAAAVVIYEALRQQGFKGLI